MLLALKYVGEGSVYLLAYLINLFGLVIQVEGIELLVVGRIIPDIPF
jgi:hypothetical protein